MNGPNCKILKLQAFSSAFILEASSDRGHLIYVLLFFARVKRHSFFLLVNSTRCNLLLWWLILKRKSMSFGYSNDLLPGRIMGMGPV
ncbi:hypothetical protein Bca4012_016648 [Brassica carinata]